MVSSTPLHLCRARAFAAIAATTCLAIGFGRWAVAEGSADGHAPPSKDAGHKAPPARGAEAPHGTPARGGPAGHSAGAPAAQSADHGTTHAADGVADHGGNSGHAEAHGDTNGFAVNAGAGAVVDAPAPAHAETHEPVDAAAALAMLREGNGRWVGGRPQSPHADASRRSDTAANGQHPFATIVTCADSRIPVERAFDQGVGDLFVVRVAGNVAGVSELGTMEYGVEHLHTPLLVIMGHTGCGAVTAAVAAAEAAAPADPPADPHAHGEAANDHIGALLAHIEPAVERARRQHPNVTGPDFLDLAVRENVWQTIFEVVRSSPACRNAVRTGRLEVVGAVYNLSTGEVAWLGEHPWQAEIVAAFPDNVDEP